MQEKDFNEEIKGLFFYIPKENKFIRREDLTLKVRVQIGVAATIGIWGAVTALSRKHKISRTFIYMLKETLPYNLKKLFGENVVKSGLIDKEIMVKEILSLRLVGRVTLLSISELLNMRTEYNLSKSFIAEVLDKVGYLLPCYLQDVSPDEKILIICSDEIFANGKPILISVEPLSSVILAMELSPKRDEAAWKAHFEKLKFHGFKTAYIVSDCCSAIKAAAKNTFDKLEFQPDTFHAVAHKLGKWVHSLEGSMDKAIKQEWHILDVFESAKSEKKISERIQEYEQAVEVTNAAIERYENFAFLYNCAIAELPVFDRQGYVRKRDVAEQNMKVALELMRELGHYKINEAIKSIENILEDLFYYLDRAKEIVDELNNSGVDIDILNGFYKAWQLGRNATKAKQAKRKAKYKFLHKEKLTLLEDLLEGDFVSLSQHIFKELDKAVQSSAMVETINSILRPYLNSSRNHVSQNMLNLILFYHNHRRYQQGKRKGMTPLEIFTGEKQEERWDAILWDKVKDRLPEVMYKTKEELAEAEEELAKAA